MHPTSNRWKKKIFLYPLLSLWVISTLLSILATSTAQSQSSTDWSTPVNLSNSGSASDPAIVYDSNGLIHVLWIDEFSGYVYVVGDGTEWSDPSAIDVPFEIGTPAQGFEKVSPRLVADQLGMIHAIWRAGDDGSLYYSRVAATDFDTFASWTEPLQIEFSSLDFDIEIDDFGDIHFSYVRPLDSDDYPSGVYYNRLDRETGLWPFPVLLYPSKYFRSIGFEDSNVEISTNVVDDNVRVFVSWDNRSRQRVYLTKSFDTGVTWEEPQVIDKPDVSEGSVSPINILVSSEGENVLTVWQRRDSAGNCTNHYQWSNDEGESWTDPEQMLPGAQLCGQESQLIFANEGMLLFWTIISDQVYLLAWDKDHWSDPIVQNELSTLEDTETLTSVTLSFRKAAFTENGRLAVVGCDSSGVGDIWFTLGDLRDVSGWFSNPLSWSRPVELISGLNEYQSPVLVSGPEDLLHVLYSQIDSSEQGANRSAVFYLGGNGEQWGQPVRILNSPQSNAKDPSAALDTNGRILVVWSESQSGGIYYSWANAARANIPTEWETPVQLPIPQPILRSPHILIDKMGTIHVIYAIPINEERGIYSIRSEDGGETWLSPTPVFDAVGAGFQMVDRPQLAQTSDGVLHALWVRASLPEAGGVLGLYYAYSKDGGETWSQAEEVVNGNVTWSQISSDVEGIAYRFWQEDINRQPVIKFQRQPENGNVWEPPESLSSFGESLRVVKLVSIPFGELQMLQILQDSAGRQILRNWVWEEERWVVSEVLELANDGLMNTYSMVSGISPTGDIDLIYFTKKVAALSNDVQYKMLFTSRSIGSPAGNQETPENTSISPETSSGATSEATTATTPAATEIPTPTPAPDLSSLGPVEATPSGDGATTGILVGIVISGVIIFAVLGVGIWRNRSG